MNIPHKIIVEDPSDVYGFDGHKTNPSERITLDVAQIGKVLSVDFLLMDSKSP